jgi:hypothetical protein
MYNELFNQLEFNSLLKFSISHNEKIWSIINQLSKNSFFISLSKIEVNLVIESLLRVKLSSINSIFSYHNFRVVVDTNDSIKIASQFKIV